MQMQEPEQWQQSGQEWKASQEDSEYRAGYAENAQYAGGFESEQQQKIYPQEERWLNGTAFSIFAIILSSIGFFLAVAGIVGSSIVLEYVNGQEAILAGGVIGGISSTIAASHHLNRRSRAPGCIFSSSATVFRPSTLS